MYSAGMASAPLPEEILDRFRTSSRNRLLQVQTSWKALTQGMGSDEMAREMHRNVHTLKGDSRMVQFHDIDLVCQKLEDLLSAADSRQYKVSQDFALVLDMALDFIGLLLRRRGDQEVGGINLAGFVAQVNQVIRQEAVPSAIATGPLASEEYPRGGEEVADRLSLRTRQQLAVAATKVFLEYLSASGAARTRLRSAWSELQQEIERFDSVPLAALVSRHAQAATEVAKRPGLDIHIEVLLGSELRISADALCALDVALMHGLRNALSHGFGRDSGRASAGRDVGGRIEIRCQALGKTGQISIVDDGAGIDLEYVRERAVATRAMHPDLAGAATSDELIELLFQPRFTTREEVGEVAGRGIGLDAIRTAVRKVGGDVALADNRAGAGGNARGSTLTIELPLVRREIEVHAFDAYGGRLVLAVSSEWQASWHKLRAGSDPVDPVARLQIRRPEDDTGLLATGVPEVLRLESKGGAVVELVATRSSRTLVAERICPTPDSFPVEVVTVAGAEVLLLRPDKLPIPVPELPEW